MSWRVLAIVSVFLLGACNMVTTDTPTFTAADAVGAPPLKDGLWVSYSPNCKVVLRDSATQWPECVNWWLVDGDRLSTTGAPDRPMILAAGWPRIMQIGLPTEANPPMAYFYLGLRPAAFDEEGRIIAEHSWTVSCSPPDKGSKTMEEARNHRPPDPFPGMVMLADDSQNCRPEDKAALLRAAILSERYADFGSHSRWIREPRPEEIEAVRAKTLINPPSPNR